jgi:hypothetical protein
MNADLPLPPIFLPQIRIERAIDFDPRNTFDFEFSTSNFLGIEVTRNGTSNSPQGVVSGDHQVASPWRVVTSSGKFDRSKRENEASKRIPRDIPGQLAEIRVLTGYGWERIAKLLRSTRQAVYNWTNGASISEVNREHLAKLFATLSYIDRGSAEENRALLDSSLDGRMLSEWLSEGEFELVRNFAGRGSGRPDEKWGPPGRRKVAASDHWFTRILDVGELESDEVRRARPQKLTPLKLRRG